MIQVPPAQERKLTVSPRGAPVNTEVTVSMDGLPPELPIIIGFGSLAAHELLAETDSGARGSIRLTLAIPYWAEVDRPHFFFFAFADQRPQGFSPPFQVTAADGTVRVAGTIRGTGTDCLEMEGPGETLYALQGNLGSWEPGTRVRVLGTMADDPACGGDGIPIAVGEIVAR